jgi:RNA polymerase sigma-70 factor (ECF subfamily)
LFAIHESSVRSRIRRIVRDESTTEDLTQDTFLRASRAASSLADPERVGPWLRRIGERIALDELRRRKRVSVGIEDSAEPLTVSAEDVVLASRLSPRLAAALERLPERQRRALLLAEFGELSGEEIATVMSISHGAVRALLARARTALRAELLAATEI